MIRFFLCICKSVMENHYNLLYREDERELIPICKQMNVSLMPYSPLAAGHLARPTWKSESLRGRTDRVAVGKYDRMEDADMKIVTRVHELAEKYQCKMSQIAIAWQWAKGVTSPIIGATKMQHLDDAVGALNVRLTAEGIEAWSDAWLELLVVEVWLELAQVRLRELCYRGMVLQGVILKKINVLFHEATLLPVLEIVLVLLSVLS